eukprot:COSAG02_NODE_5155_length_4583_cov_2.407449_1_plen_30_part_10
MGRQLNVAKDLGIDEDEIDNTLDADDPTAA